MTKFILHGGETKVCNIHNRNFFREIVKGLKSPVKVLDITFARKKSKWKTGIVWDKEKFQRAVKNKKIEITMASEKPSILRNQIQDCHVVFIIGGLEMKYLKGNLGKLKDFKKLIRGKVVAGSSAGAYVLSQYYYTRSRNRVEKGLGILPVKTLAHYDRFKSKIAVKKLAKIGKNLKLYKIPETRYVVLKRTI